MWRFITRTRLLMRNRIDIIPAQPSNVQQMRKTSGVMKEEPDYGELRAQIDRLREWKTIAIIHSSAER